MAEFGLYLPQVGLGFPQVEEAVAVAEAAGFGRVWFIDHFEVPGIGGIMDGWTVAAAIGALTSTIRVGHLVLCVAIRPPAVLGKMAVTLDQITGGRLDLGLGSGSNPAELRAYLGSADSAAVRREKLAETIQIVRRILVGDPVSFAGKHYSVDVGSAAPAAVQAHVPIFLGGYSPAIMKLVRGHADWWNCPSFAQPRLSELAPLSRPARISVNYSVAFAAGSRLHRAGSETAPVLVGDDLALAETLAADQALGVELFNIQFVQVDHLHHHMVRFMEEVAPALS